jgi:ABC-type glycerol-3-phosphate transport system permease component
VCFAKHTLNKHNLGRTIFLQQLHRNKEKKKTLPSEAKGEGEGNSAGTDWRMLSSSSFQSLLPLFLVFFFFGSLL